IGCLSVPLSAQTPTTKKSPRSITGTTQTDRTATTQVVKIVHRLNSLKMFRLLLRSSQPVEAIAGFDQAFNLTDDVHTNIIAGLAMDDGRTIVAWLPEAEVEFGPSVFSPGFPPQVKAGRAPVAPSVPKAVPSTFPFRGGMFGSPDLEVIGPNGIRLKAEYVGLDGATGLSILRLAETSLEVSERAKVKQIDEGEDVVVLNPEPADSSQPLAAGSLYVRMGTTSGRIESIKQAPAGGGLARVRVKSPRLSSRNIGGVAVNQAGETIGIVDAVEGPEATILPTTLIRRAANRRLAQHASVPRPWLGVKGEALMRLNAEQMKLQGWHMDQAAALLEKQRGILLTSIALKSPAAVSSSRAGDAILQVNNIDVQSGEDFTWWLDQAGPSSWVTF